jgi:hypothetical protein
MASAVKRLNCFSDVSGSSCLPPVGYNGQKFYVFSSVITGLMAFSHFVERCNPFNLAEITCLILNTVAGQQAI